MGREASAAAQLRKGVLEYCVLALLKQEERYGFDLARTLGSVEGLVTSEGTIYPLLSRLHKEGLIAATWRESESGPPRKYYAITHRGADALRDFQVEWQMFSKAVSTLITKGVHS